MSRSGEYPPVWADIPFLSGSVVQDGMAQEGTFLLDTGAQVSTMPVNMAMGVGLDSNGDGLLDENDDNFARYETVGGVGGQTTAPVFLFDEFHVDNHNRAPTWSGPIYSGSCWTSPGDSLGFLGQTCSPADGSSPISASPASRDISSRSTSTSATSNCTPPAGARRTGLIHFDLNPNVAQVTDPAVPGALIVETDRYTMVTEAGMNDIYRVVLTQQPAADVTINH